MTSDLLQLWFGVRAPVHRGAYAASGFSLMLLKYAVEAIVIWVFASAVLMPWDFLSPVLTMRLQLLRGAPPWVGWALFTWSLPFLWIAITMSVRRAADAGHSPWLGLLIIVPLFNLVFMLVMCAVPSAHGETWAPRYRPPQDQDQAKDAVLALGLCLMVGATMMVVSVYLLKAYGSALFVGTPLFMGVVAAYLFNRVRPRSYGASMAMGCAAIFSGGMALLLFA